MIQPSPSSSQWAPLIGRTVVSVDSETFVNQVHLTLDDGTVFEIHIALDKTFEPEFVVGLVDGGAA